MAEYEITCVIFDQNHVISHVGLRGFNPEPILNVVTWITNRVHNFYTFKNGRRAEVDARYHQQTGKWYLTTLPDDTRLNNLDFLPQC